MPVAIIRNNGQFLANKEPEGRGYDEFGSLVNAQVRQIAAAACAKAVRREGLRFVAVTCHDDVAPWLEADWVMLVDGDDVRLKGYTDAPPAGAPQKTSRSCRGGVFATGPRAARGAV